MIYLFTFHWSAMKKLGENENFPNFENCKFKKIDYFVGPEAKMYECQVKLLNNLRPKNELFL